MALVEEAVYQTLTGSTLVTALCGNRVYPLKAPQNPTFPCAVYQRVSWVPEGDLTHQPAPLGRPRIRVRAYAETYLAECRALAEAIRKTLDGFEGTVTVGSTTVVIQASTLQYQVDAYEVLSDDRGVYVTHADYLIYALEST